MKSQGGVIKLRSRITVLEKGRTIVKCMSCGSELEVPIKLDETFNSEESTSTIPLYVRK